MTMKALVQKPQPRRGSIIMALLLCCYSLANLVEVTSAFVPLHVQLPYSFSSSPLSVSSSSSSTSPVILFAGKKKKNTANKKKKNQQQTRGGGGGGFGSNNSPTNVAAAASSNNKKKTTTATAKTMTAAAARKQQQQKQQPAPPISGAAMARLHVHHATKKSMAQSPKEEKLLAADDVNVQLMYDIYKDEYQRQQDSIIDMDTDARPPRQLVQLSHNPLIFTIDEFIDPSLCKKVQNDASGCFDLYFPETCADTLFGGQESELDGLLFNAASSLDHHSKLVGSAYPDGLHMDTNNRCMFRHVTCLVYLNDVPKECGGATVFPIARALPNDPALQSARRLLSKQLSHTKSPEIVNNLQELQDDVAVLESRIGTDFIADPAHNTAIKIQPKAGRLLLFFSRDSNGKEDPRTWHAGERIHHHPLTKQVTEKRILTLFKEVEYTNNNDNCNNGDDDIEEDDDDDDDEDDGDELLATRRRRKRNVEATTFEEYLAPMVEEQRNWLRAKAQLQRALLTRGGGGGHGMDG